jgi:hypothetical protein
MQGEGSIIKCLPAPLRRKGGFSRQSAHTPIYLELLRQRSRPIAHLQVAPGADALHDPLHSVEIQFWVLHTRGGWWHMCNLASLFCLNYAQPPWLRRVWGFLSVPRSRILKEARSKTRWKFAPGAVPFDLPRKVRGTLRP